MKNPYSKRLAGLRQLMSAHGVDGFIIPHRDAFFNEYLPESSQRLAFMTNFTGSAGMAIIMSDHASLFVDGRYALQAQQQVDTETFSIQSYSLDTLQQWLKQTLQPHGVIGYDPWLHSPHELRQLTKMIERCQARMHAMSPNPIDRLWTDKPPLPQTKIIPFPDDVSGDSTAHKIKKIQAVLRTHDCHATILTSPPSVCWLFNIRASDIPHMPVCLARAILYAKGQPTLFLNETRYHNPPASITLAPEHAFTSHITTWSHHDDPILLDPRTCPAWIHHTLQEQGCAIIQADDPCLVLKACKTSAEIHGSTQAHIRDAVALTQFFAWLEQQPPNSVSEHHAAHMVCTYRQRHPSFQQPSFPTISASGKNAAIVHYIPDSQKSAIIKDNTPYLIDSGAHYTDGTTDVTRTLFINHRPDRTAPQEIKHLYTLVLKGHIAVASIRFPPKTTGTQLDSLARQYLWQHGLNYDHSTGHGVGSVLSVHESPPSLSRHHPSHPLMTGMIFSNEPGYYKAHHYGMRIENLMLVLPPISTTQNAHPMHTLKNLTLLPYDIALIDDTMLTTQEKSYLTAYYATIKTHVMPHLDQDGKTWLERQCALPFC